MRKKMSEKLIIWALKKFAFSTLFSHRIREKNTKK